MAVKSSINGFGCIGRWAVRLFGAPGVTEIVAINDLTSPEMLAHLLKSPTLRPQGRYDGHTVEAGEGSITVDGKKITIYANPNPAETAWASWV